MMRLICGLCLGGERVTLLGLFEDSCRSFATGTDALLDKDLLHRRRADENIFSLQFLRQSAAAPNRIVKRGHDLFVDDFRRR